MSDEVKEVAPQVGERVSALSGRQTGAIVQVTMRNIRIAWERGDADDLTPLEWQAYAERNGAGWLLP